MAQSPKKERLEATLERAAGGDETAWRLVVDTYSGRVYGLIRAQCGSSDLAQEITQSTFCTVVAKIGRYTELGRFESWLFRIAMNRLRDEMRRRKRQANPVPEEALVGLAGPAAPAAGDQADPDEVRALEAALARLSEADRRVIQLRHSAGLSFAQIAEVLGEPLGTVLARQHRALKKLRHLLGRPDPPPANQGQSGGRGQ
jgi:RNA polymerase sigma-70 factor (ECF subfamily)